MDKKYFKIALQGKEDLTEVVGPSFSKFFRRAIRETFPQYKFHFLSDSSRKRGYRRVAAKVWHEVIDKEDCEKFITLMNFYLPNANTRRINLDVRSRFRGTGFSCSMSNLSYE